MMRQEVLEGEVSHIIPDGEWRKLMFNFYKVKALEEAGLAKLPEWQAAVKPIYDKWYGADEPATPTEVRQPVAVDSEAPAQ